MKQIDLMARASACAVAATVFCALPAASQSLAPGDHILSLHYSSLDREDQGFKRDARTVMLSYGYQATNDLRILAFLGSIQTDNSFPPDTQSTSTPTYGLGLHYNLFRGGSLTGTLLRGPISEDFTSGGITTAGSGDTLTATLQFDQIVPISQRGFLKGSASASHSKSDFQTVGLSSDQTTNRYTFGVEYMHFLGQNWMVSAGLKRTWADYIITISDEKRLDRASLSATYRVNEDLGFTVGWTQALGAEDTHQRLDLSVTHRF